MNDEFLAGMAEATRLTRAGRLHEATALIQRTLRGLQPHSSAAEYAAARVIDAVPLPDEAATRGTHQETRPSPAPTASHMRLHGVADALRAKLGSLSRPAVGPSNREVWAGGRFIDGTFTNQAGTRAYKLYIPGGYHGQALPLVVMLHGCTQSPDDFAAGTRMNALAERELFLVAYPEQASPANPSKCWNWFKTSEQSRGQGEPSLIAGITRQVMSAYRVDARRVYVAGLSAGGAMAAILGIGYPDLYAAIGVHSGLACGAAHDLSSALAAMRNGGTGAVRPSPAGINARIVPTIVFHGDRDTTVHPRNGDQVLAQWRSAGPTPTVSRGQVPQGHAYTRSIYRDANGHATMEQWLIHGAGHGWSGGSPEGSFTDALGPDAAREMVRFFLAHSLEDAA